MKRLKIFLLFALALSITVAPAASALARMADMSPTLIQGALLGLAAVLSFTPVADHLSGLYTSGLQKEIWKNDIIGVTYKDNEFAKRSVDASAFVLDGKVVHIPVAGSNGTVKRNLTSFPQTAVERADTDITYSIDTYYILPRRIAQLDKYELSYDKRMSVIGEDIKQLTQDTMNGLLYNWAPAAANCILTDGSLSATDMIDTTATGSRRLFTKTAFSTVVKKIRRTDTAGRITAALTATHYYQLIESLSEGEKTAFYAVADMKEGIVGRYMGADVIMRSSVLRYRLVSSVLTVVDELDPAFAAAVDDRAASLFYVDSCVERAEGDVDVFDNPGQALYYGDIFSAMRRLGGRIRRTTGVYAIVEASS